MGARKRITSSKPQGEWIDAIAQPDELVINVGDMLSRHTNNKLKSTIHQVNHQEIMGTSRYSVPFSCIPL
jgi:isopenicillin N synthase-like dioxygenase